MNNMSDYSKRWYLEDLDKENPCLALKTLAWLWIFFGCQLALALCSWCLEINSRNPANACNRQDSIISETELWQRKQFRWEKRFVHGHLIISLMKVVAGKMKKCKTVLKNYYQKKKRKEKGDFVLLSIGFLPHRRGIVWPLFSSMR